MIDLLENHLEIATDGQLTSSSYLLSTNRVVLNQNSVHVWFANMPTRSVALNFFIQQLNADELERMSRFIFEPLRHRFACAHGLLRLILSRYTGYSPTELIFCSGLYGKPSLLNPTDLTFSLSHSGNGVAVAIARGVQIGLDIEFIKHIEGRDELVSQFFSVDEAGAYNSLPANQKEGAFFRIWTRKEAFVKGLGLGLTHPLGSFTVSSGMPLTLQGPLTESWTLRHLEPGHGFVGAIAIQSKVFSLAGGSLCAQQLDHFLT